MGKTNLREAVHTWIRDDAGLSLKMVIHPVDVDALLSRLLPLLTAAETAAHARGKQEGFREGIEKAAEVAEKVEALSKVVPPLVRAIRSISPGP
ncbi:hypothetical protein [Microvirga mediterraneensis]|uniref:Uncharacterized protein n=1 Tax=Microvirga mediterraneensis TaxID=2754695 RepID=A0A838BVH9_9HYPH|nr:hypothetical protein [Microvirga mediterraneensis]MBA1159358.1 hypothetical protein [Microvirga mediterraneensis]